jgi:arylsulfatase A-like enzyme
MKKDGISRRDFLKLLSLLPAAALAEPLLKSQRSPAGAGAPNIIILVFDAWSGSHMALNGYPRLTMPSVERFAGHATVYHNHYTAGMFTVPGTASLLTGLHPWTHRAFNLGAGITHAHAEHQIFAALHATHTTLGYAQNKYADQFLYQAGRPLDIHVHNGRFNLQDNLIYSKALFQNDAHIAFNSFEDNIFQRGTGYDGSLFIGPAYRLAVLRGRLRALGRYENDYPRGLPDNTEYFVLNDLVDGTIEQIGAWKSPTLAYFHFFPPHDPYRPTKKFFHKFRKGWQPSAKPVHPLARISAGYLVSKGDARFAQNFYDEYLMSWDAEVERLFAYLKQSGLLDNSYVILTADHGELHERGVSGHMSALLYDAVIHVPLIISAPGQQERVDIHTNTSSVDLLPTLAHLSGNPIPSWAEGRLLPGQGGVEDPERSVYILDAKRNGSFAPLSRYSISMTKGPYRLTRYQYQEYAGYEFYDLLEDPAELRDLFPSAPSAALKMRAELDQKLDEVNRPFAKVK